MQPNTSSQVQPTASQPNAQASGGSLAHGKAAGSTASAPSSGPSLPPRRTKAATSATALQAAPASSSSPAADSGASSAAADNGDMQQGQQQPQQVTSSSVDGAEQKPSSSNSTVSATSSQASPSTSLVSGGGSGPKRPAGGAAGGGGGSGSGGGSSHASGFMPMLPPRQAPPPAGPVLDPDEPQDLQQVRARIHAVRVSLIRAAQRLGYDADNGLVRQVLYRLALAEKLKAPWRRSTRRADPNQAAAREAARLEAAQAAAGSSQQPLGFCVKMMLVGLAGTGKSQLIHALLGHKQEGSGDAASWPVVDAMEGATRNCTLHKGEACGIPLQIMDTPGLLAAAAGTAHNQAVLQQIRRTFRTFKPDLVLYVDRLDAGGAARWGGELPALQGLSNALGPGTWLNTIVALTHAGSPPPQGARGPLPWDQWASQRSHALQQVIRAASGDNRLMNPTAFVESHPGAAPRWGRDACGVPLLFNGMAWRPHLLLMVVSAKLLADTEAMLQMQEGGEGGASGSNAAAQQLLMSQMMGSGARTLPLPFLVSQATQFSQPLHYPDHDQVMAVRQVEAMAAATPDERQHKQLVRQAKAMRLQIKQAVRYKEKMARSFRMATLAGSKITPEPPPLATKRPPSAHPPCTFRYRVPEAAGGWVVRPSLEPHGMDVGDGGIEGLQMEQFTVLGRKAAKRKRAKPPKPPQQPDVQQQQQQQQQEATTTSSSSIADHSQSTPPPHLATTASAAAAAAAGVVQQPALQPTPSQAPPPQKDAAQPRAAQEEEEEEEGGAAVQLGGAPAHHFLSAQASKGAVMLQGRSETTLYHDTLGNTTTSLSADVQASSSGGGPLDALVCARADLRRKQVPFLPGGGSNRATLGLMLARLAEGGRLNKGPIALGGRVQHTFQSKLGGGMPRRKPVLRTRDGLKLARSPPMPRKAVPLDFAAALAVLAAPWGSTSQDTAASLAALGSAPAAGSLEPEVCLGGNLEVTAEMQELLGTRKSAPLTLAANLVRYKGEAMRGLAASLQLQGKRKDACSIRLQLGSKGKAGLNVKVRSGQKWWMGLVAMAVPLVSLLLELAGIAS